jgi:1,6-anhydro-N-acetylmuramate kinase
MPQIIVTADGESEEWSVMLRERVNVADFESDRFAENLVERLGWAVLDAAEIEREPGAAKQQAEAPQPKRRFERQPVEDRVPQPA